MVRLITAFACALVANADYICTRQQHPDGVTTDDCQCLTMVEDYVPFGHTNPVGIRTVWALSAGDANGQSDFNYKGGISYTFSDGQELCLTHPNVPPCDEPPCAYDSEGGMRMTPCDYDSEGGIFIPHFGRSRTSWLYHIGASRENQTEECLEPNLIAGKRQAMFVGECSSFWTISPTPLCPSRPRTSEMVIS